MRYSAGLEGSKPCWYVDVINRTEIYALVREMARYLAVIARLVIGLTYAWSLRLLMDALP